LLAGENGALPRQKMHLVRILVLDNIFATIADRHCARYFPINSNMGPPVKSSACQLAPSLHFVGSLGQKNLATQHGPDGSDTEHQHQQQQHAQ
jgi:hypothetical protein